MEKWNYWYYIAILRTIQSHTNETKSWIELFLFIGYTWNHLTVGKEEQYLIVCKQISSVFSKIELQRNYSLTNHMYNQLTLCNLMTDVKLHCLCQIKLSETIWYHNGTK